MSDAVKRGLRVVRGVDWEWDDQDGGEGHVGTVVDVGGKGNSKHPSQTVVVAWDDGKIANYRFGYEGKDDLRVLDSAPAGVVHKRIFCDECRVSGLFGFRWKCAVCDDYDLCHSCYMEGKHNANHKFYRYDTFACRRITVPPRSESRKLMSKGIFVGAKVTRGAAWSYGDQDGGSGKQGQVKSIGDDMSGQSRRSWVKVVWSNGKAYDYRRGHEGSVNVKYAQAVDGGFYYVDHLPSLGTFGRSAHRGGDMVQYDVDALPQAMKLQLCQDSSLKAIGKVTNVNEEEQRLTVDFGTKNSEWHPSYFIKARELSVGDCVTILDDAATVKQLQNGHGGWINQMKAILGKTGTVVALTGEGNLKVQSDDQTWVLNPQCCTSDTSKSDDSDGDDDDDDDDDDEDDEDDDNDKDGDDDDDSNNAFANIAGLMQMFMDMQLPNVAASADSIVSEAAHGNVTNVKKLVKLFPQQVDVKKENRTALMVASHQGHKQVVAVLLDAGAKPEVKDDDGDNSYHYAAYGNQPVVMEMLLKKTVAGMNARNGNGRSALQVAVCKQNVDCVKVLINYNCDVNLQDKDEDTSLHDALYRKYSTIVDLLLDCNRVDFKLKNQKGLNVLHLAAARGNHEATGKIVKKAKQLVNVAMSNGDTPLHLTVANGHSAVATVLIDEGGANMEVTNARCQTALLGAINRGHAPLIELLTLKGANLEAEDSDGDTAIHLVCIQLGRLQRTAQSAGIMTMLMNVTSDVMPHELDKAQQIYKLFSSFKGGKEASRAWLAIACFLAENGADTEHRNRSNKSPMDELGDASVRDHIKQHSKTKTRPTTASTSQTRLSSAPTSTKCMMCTTEPIGMTFRPCGHSVACIECSSRMKQCFHCHERIQEKVRVDVTQLQSVGKCKVCDAERVAMEFRPCKHRVACIDCSRRMKTCVQCKQAIQEKVMFDVCELCL